MRGHFYDAPREEGGGEAETRDPQDGSEPDRGARRGHSGLLDCHGLHRVRTQPVRFMVGGGKGKGKLSYGAGGRTWNCASTVTSVG
jgi:hypothetical protein